MSPDTTTPFVYPHWYVVSQLCVCGTAALIFWIIYKYPIPNTDQREEPQREKGLLFVALAAAIWALWAAIAWIDGSSTQLRIYFSILNSVFFLLATAFFEYGPRRLKFFQLHERWVWLVICAALVIASITSNIENLFWQKVPDIILSTITLGFLGWAICYSFFNRLFKQASIVAGAVVAYVYYAQLLEIVPLFSNISDVAPTENHLIILLTSKTLLLMILLLVAISWLDEQWLAQLKESRIAQFPENQIRIHITGKRNPENNRRWVVEVESDDLENNSPEKPKRIQEMTSKPHQLLIQFALRKEKDPLENGGMMNIVDDSFYHADLNKIHKLLHLEIPALFKNHRRNGYYLLRDNIRITLNEKELMKDPDVFAVMKREIKKAGNQSPTK